MYHAHRYSKTSWAGEPEIDPTMDYEEREKVEGWELKPAECLELAYGGVMREQAVINGALLVSYRYVLCAEHTVPRIKYSVYCQLKRVIWDSSSSEVSA